MRWWQAERAKITRSRSPCFIGTCGELYHAPLTSPGVVRVVRSCRPTYIDYIARLAVLRFTSVGSSLCQKQQPVKLGRRCIASGRVQFQLARDPPTSAELLSTAGFFLLQSCRVCAASFDFLSRRVDSGQSLNCTCTSWSTAAPVFPHELCKKSMYGSACIETVTQHSFPVCRVVLLVLKK